MTYLPKIFRLLAMIIILTAGSARAADEVRVRSADHPGFSRVVFDFVAPTEYRVVRNGNAVELQVTPSFDPAFAGDVDLSRIDDAVVASHSDTTVISFQVDPRFNLRHFKDGIRLVLDVVDPSYAEADDTADAEAPASTEPPKIDSNPPSSQARAEAQSAETEQQSAREPDAVGDARQTEPVSIGSDDTSVPNRRVVTVNSSIGTNGYQLSFEWDAAVNSAVFARAGILWVVFDRPARFELTPAAAEMGRRFRSIEQSAGEDFALVRIGLEDPKGVAVSQSATSWVVTLSDQPREPTIPLVLTRQDTEADGFRIFMPYDRPGSHLRLADPLIGDTLDVIPLANAGTGLGNSRIFAEFDVLSSAHGMVVASKSDRVIVSRYANGVAVGSIANLAVSGPTLPRRFGEIESTPSDSFTPMRLIDLATWRQGGLENFVPTRQRLEREISVADGDSRNARRWDYARFMLAHGFGSEAAAILTLMEQQDPELAKSPSFRAVRGLAQILDHDFEAAAESLSLPELDAEPEIWLWRGRAAEAQGRHLTALNHFDRGRDAFSIVAPGRVGELQLSALRAALEVANAEDARLYLNWLTEAPLSPAQAAEAIFLEGRFLELRGQRANALDRYARVEARHNPRIAALARLTRVVSDLGNNEIGRDAAIEELEQLRYVWRGDEVERAVLKSLGNLYFDAQNYRAGLETLRQLVSMTPDDEEGRQATERMSAAFRELFLGGVADRLPEVTALALYYDFRELTPLGQEGDQMIRRLADRLVSVDLLGHAAELLDHQVRFRLEGAAQAIVATRLAKIHILNKQPEEALDIIRVTRQTDLPEDVVRERKLVEARVLTELGRFEEADILVADLSGEDVDRLRADIYWGWRSWKRLADATAILLDARDGGQAPLTDLERQTLLRHAIAVSMEGDASGLVDLRERYGDAMQHGRFANAFDIITSADRYSSDKIRDVVSQTAAVADLQSFMEEYRAEFVSSVTSGAIETGGS